MPTFDDAATGSARPGSNDNPLPVGVEPQHASSPPLALTRGYEAFLRDLPLLLQEHCGEWIAYDENRRLGISSSKRQLYRDCLAAGIPQGSFLICSIEPIQSVKLDDLSDV